MIAVNLVNVLRMVVSLLTTKKPEQKKAPHDDFKTETDR